MGLIRFAWTDARLEKLKAMSFAGRSYADIAAEFGISRSSIAGKMYRLGGSAIRANPGSRPVPWGDDEVSELRDRHAQGLGTRAIAVAMNRSRYSVKNKLAELKLEPNRAPRTYVQRPRRTFAENLAELVAAAQVERPVPVDDSAIPLEQRKTLMGLTDKCCRWACGEVGEPGFFFCGGAVVAGLPYCRDHALRAYVPWERRTSLNGWRDLKW